MCDSEKQDVESANKEQVFHTESGFYIQFSKNLQTSL